MSKMACRYERTQLGETAGDSAMELWGDCHRDVVRIERSGTQGAQYLPPFAVTRKIQDYLQAMDQSGPAPMEVGFVGK